MFCNRAFAGRMFASRYFPKHGGSTAFKAIWALSANKTVGIFIEPA